MLVYFAGRSHSDLRNDWTSRIILDTFLDKYTNHIGTLDNTPNPSRFEVIYSKAA